MNTVLIVLFWILFRIYNGCQRIKQFFYVCAGISYRRYDDHKTGTYHYEREK